MKDLLVAVRDLINFTAHHDQLVGKAEIRDIELAIARKWCAEAEDKVEQALNAMIDERIQYAIDNHIVRLPKGSS